MNTTITLESIKAEHTRLAEMIAAFEAQSTGESIHFPELLLELNPGERYAGLIVGKDGEPSYHLVLLPGSAENLTWVQAVEWSAKQGGQYTASLPTRREQSLLFSNLKEEFEREWYWSNEAHASESGWAWHQYFGNGGQNSDHEDVELRARAVRRLVIE